MVEDRGASGGCSGCSVLKKVGEGNQEQIPGSLPKLVKLNNRQCLHECVAELRVVC